MAKKNIDRQALMQAVRESHELTNEQKADILQFISEQKKYGLVWEDSVEEIEETLRTKIPVLVEDKNKLVPSDGEDAPNHILIEGDNLPALDALTYTHEGKVDVIYIDPPYNTGNKDFVYNDSFVDSEDGYRHSKWLSFMEKRLRIAKKLLSDKGVIFISIDDNEQANLKLLCDEVFGGNKYLNHLAWVSNITGRQISGSGAAKTWESVLAYSKNNDHLLPFNVNINFAKSKMPDAYKGFQKDIRKDKYGEFSIGDTLYNHNRKFNEETRPNLVFSIFYNPQTEDIIPGDIGEYHEGYVEILPHANGDGKHKYHAWRWSRKKIIEETYNLIALPKSKGQFEMHTRIRDFNDTTLKDIITNIPNGDSELQAILGSKKFDYPKSVDLLRLLIASISSKDSLILDFFAGSGTTLHATMQLNAEDGGHRQCILVTNNENNICEEVTYERNKRVIMGYTTPKGVEVEGLHNNNLRYYKMDFLPREESFEAKQNMIRKCVDMLCIKENIFTERREFCGLKFKPSLLRYFKDEEKQMLVIFDERVIEHVVPMIATIQGRLKVFVFSNGQYGYEDEFMEVKDKVEVTALPEAILQVYRNVLPQKEEEAMI